jgi:hypothetical protein
MPNAFPPFQVSFKKVARAVERFGEEFWYNVVSSSLILNFPLFSPGETPPQTPRMLLQSQTRIASVLDFGITAKHSQSVARELEKRPVFQLIFLNNDEDQSVKVKEVDEIDFVEVKMRVEKGDSVFITKRENEKIDVSSLSKEKKKNRVISLGDPKHA